MCLLIGVQLERGPCKFSAAPRFYLERRLQAERVSSLYEAEATTSRTSDGCNDDAPPPASDSNASSNSAPHPQHQHQPQPQPQQAAEDAALLALPRRAVDIKTINAAPGLDQVLIARTEVPLLQLIRSMQNYRTVHALIVDGSDRPQSVVGKLDVKRLASRINRTTNTTSMSREEFVEAVMMLTGDKPSVEMVLPSTTSEQRTTLAVALARSTSSPTDGDVHTCRTYVRICFLVCVCVLAAVRGVRGLRGALHERALL